MKKSAIIILLLPVILGISAVSFVQQSISPNNVKDDLRYDAMAGWLDTRMNEHWERLAASKSGDFTHDAKNILAEWCRLDPPRAGKTFSFLLAVSVIVNVIQWLN